MDTGADGHSEFSVSVIGLGQISYIAEGKLGQVILILVVWHLFCVKISANYFRCGSEDETSLDFKFFMKFSRR